MHVKVIAILYGAYFQKEIKGFRVKEEIQRKTEYVQREDEISSYNN